MATHRISILGGAKPDTSGKVWWEPFSILASADNYDRLILRFDEDGTNATALTGAVGIDGSFNVPKDYTDTANLIVRWTSTLTANDVKFDFDARAVATGETVDGTFDEAVAGEDVAPGTAYLLQEVTITLTDNKYAADDHVSFNFTVSDAAGTDMAGATLLFDLLFEYNDA